MRECPKSGANRHQLPVTNSAPGPGAFPLGSPESRAAARLMAAVRESDAETVSVHLEVVGFGDNPWCHGRSCRGRWSKAIPEERTAVAAKFENYMARACGGDTIGGFSRRSLYVQSEREWQARIAATLHCTSQSPPNRGWSTVL